MMVNSLKSAILEKSGLDTDIEGLRLERRKCSLYLERLTVTIRNGSPLPIIENIYFTANGLISINVS